MRKVIQLQTIKYINKIKYNECFIDTLSGNYNLNLFNLNQIKEEQIVTELFAKFNSETMNGFDVLAYLIKGNKKIEAIPEYLKIYRVNDGDWDEVLIGSVNLTESNGYLFYAFVSTTFLGSNELSGAETYSAEVSFSLHGKLYRRKTYFNHLGCFDNIWRIRNQIDFIKVTKLDE
jgi:hypothetical protein